MYFVEMQVLPGQWRVLSANHGYDKACREIGLLRRFWPPGKDRVYRIVRVFGVAA